MPIIKSAAKRVRTSEKARQKNASIKSRVSSARRKTFEAFKTKDTDKSVQKFREYCSILDKAVKKGMVKRNTSIRRKKRAAAKLAAVLSGAQGSEVNTQAAQVGS